MGKYTFKIEYTTNFIKAKTPRCVHHMGIGTKKHTITWTVKTDSKDILSQRKRQNRFEYREEETNKGNQSERMETKNGGGNNGPMQGYKRGRMQGE